MNPLPQLRIMIPMPVEDLTPSYIRHYVRAELETTVMDGFMHMYSDLLDDTDFYSYVLAHEARSKKSSHVPFMNEYDIKVLLSRLYRGHTGHVLDILKHQFRQRGFLVLIDEELHCWIYVG